MKQIRPLVGGLLTALLFVVMGSAPLMAADPKPVTLKIGNTFASGSASVINDELNAWGKRVNERTKGGVTVQVMGDSLLGSEAEMLESLFMGSLEMSLQSIAFQSTLHPELIIEDLPYMFATREAGYAALDGDYGAAINKIIADSGEIRNLGFIELGFRHLTNNVRPIAKPEDMKGIKLRTTNSDLRRAVFETLGAMTISMGFNELFTALQQKVVDGQETPLTTINSSSLYEVQKYLSLTGHFWTNECVLINEQVWQSLPEEWRAIMMEEMVTAVANVRARIAVEDVTLADVMRQKGMEVNEVDKAAFAEALKPLYDKYEKEVIGKELMDLYRKYAGY
ncbi:MAG: DctP family TRAP transporter solute-binding subunit [Candidatus Adiutrix sp.]|jgi:tripartite ATP-independent transporter DctP family solute receptor|nr:DctP family TRAP transporter solute-binding subunit [Candidatus Adiutrix sp.]